MLKATMDIMRQILHCISYKGYGRERPMELVQSIAITPHASIALIRYGEEQLLLGATAETVTLLSSSRLSTPAATTPGDLSL
jgi:flagellar biogenesis protein FliO